MRSRAATSALLACLACLAPGCAKVLDLETLQKVDEAEREPGAPPGSGGESHGSVTTPSSPDASVDAAPRLPDAGNDATPGLGWAYRAEVTVNAAALTASAISYPALVQLAPSSFDYSKAKNDGSDLRFSATDVLGNTDIPYWIEKWQSGGESKVWVLLPSVTAGQTTRVYMFYGVGTAAVAARTSLEATFPRRFVSTQDVTLGGTQSYDWFELAAGHKLTLLTGQPLVIQARRILLTGDVLGVGVGYAGGSNAKGSGPGGGQGSSDEGAGGGGHGQAGGNGGTDSSSSTAAGGVANGTLDTPVIDMGSGGGGTDFVTGGAGGGSVTLVGRDVLVRGEIRVDGKAGLAENRCSGGGAGGGILIIGQQIALSGVCSLRGGDGGSGPNSDNDGGGGGAGGRFKAFYGETYANTGSVVLTGGAGGRFGNSSYGLNGGNGTMHTGLRPFADVVITVGPGVAL